MTDGISRRDVLAGAAAFAVAAAIPAPLARPEFLNARAEFMAAIEAYRQACDAAFNARPQIMALVKKTDITEFFRAPEIRTRRRTRIAAQQAAKQVYLSEASNEAETTIQEEVVTICAEELGLRDGLRNPSCHLTF